MPKLAEFINAWDLVCDQVLDIDLEIDIDTLLPTTIKKDGLPIPVLIANIEVLGNIPLGQDAPTTYPMGEKKLLITSRILLDQLAQAKKRGATGWLETRIIETKNKEGRYFTFV